MTSTCSPMASLSAASSRQMPHRSGHPGCGRWPLAVMKIEHPPTAMRRRARKQWRHSRRAGGGSDELARPRCLAVLGLQSSGAWPVLCAGGPTWKSGSNLRGKRRARCVTRRSMTKARSQAGAKIGTLCVRKSTFERAAEPNPSAQFSQSRPIYPVRRGRGISFQRLGRRHRVLGS
jgi:hypothetical protein